MAALMTLLSAWCLFRRCANWRSNFSPNDRFQYRQAVEDRRKMAKNTSMLVCRLIVSVELDEFAN
jgi:hypothetical protein